LHFEFLEKLNTLPGESPTQKAGRLVAFYAATMAALPATQAVGNAYAFWNAAYDAWVRTLNDAATAPAIEPQPAVPYDLVWQQIRAHIEAHVNRHTFETWFTPLVMVTGGGLLIEVTRQGPHSPIFAAYLPKHYGDVMRAAVEAVRPGARLAVIDVSAAAFERERQRQQA
jgi:hypothetical protein